MTIFFSHKTDSVQRPGAARSGGLVIEPLTLCTIFLWRACHGSQKSITGNLEAPLSEVQEALYRPHY
jgi:hypothetical protein